MSVRTQRNKSWAKKARGEFREKEWKETQQNYYGLKTTVSAGGTAYDNLVPWFKLQKKGSPIHNDMVAYFATMFGGMFR